jgi:hypothetical protein
MKLFDFLRNLTPSFTQDEVKEKLRVVTQAIHDTMGTYLNAQEILGKPGYKSKVGKDYEAAFKREVKSRFRGTAAEVTYQILTNVDTIADLLVDLVDKSYNKDIVVEGITYRRAEILRVLGYMDFLTTFARQQLHYLLVCEANEQAKTLTPGKERPKPELEFLRDNQRAFFLALTTFATPAKEVIGKLNDIPEITVTENDDQTVVHTVGIARLDPMKNNFIPGVTPMFMNIGIWWAQRQVARYERMKEDVRTIEYRLEQLRLQTQGKQDPVLEKTIAKYEEYLDELCEKIAKMEQKYK